MKEYIRFLILIIVLPCFMNLIAFSESTEAYYPLKEGKTWEYQMSLSSLLGAGGTQKVIVTNFAQRKMKDKIVTPQKIDMLGLSSFVFVSKDSEGIFEFATQIPGSIEPKIKPLPNYFLKYPIKVGTTWNYETQTILLQKNFSINLKCSIESINEVITVPAGTFKGCVKVKGVGSRKERMGMLFGKTDINVEHYNWYAPGVGTIKSIIKEVSNKMMIGSGTFSIQLESYK
ncbi:MAG: hypothetical protein GTO45_14225 [Candidatus Aminicenantes bacterium]|nr:hypothetical protein [Candidatus Aminicenantes bacterium]NIM79923.1 hypothetical protein [Candidatus Aminicenantes bacterium]NIN19262.1 hypothetical protein [Candidatus Aminicenantes bacterium]NIN43165.1 hypothetical protein [Candidatus Aminicenantes bacterium]NIN85904.1 hypothetical protein [Candidatus Aminicenantes bacterium]